MSLLTHNVHEVFQQNFVDLVKQFEGVSPFHQIRKKAFSRFMELGYPTPRNEEWKYTNVSSIANKAFSLPPSEGSPYPDLKTITRYTIEKLPGPKLVFVNGEFIEELSLQKAHLPKGARLYTLKQMFRGGDDIDRFDQECFNKHLAQHALYQDQSFVTLNTAFLNNGIFLRLRKGTVVEKSIQLVFFSSGDFVSHPRNLIVLEPDCQASIMENYIGLEESGYFTNPVTEIILEESSVLDHYKVQLESKKAYHVGHIQAIQAKNSTLNFHNYSFGGAITRNDVNSVLEGEGCHCDLNGIFLAGQDQHVDNHTLVDHAMPHCTSHEFYKGILSAKSRGVFNGKIIVRPDAQKTNAIQSNKNLILSNQASIDTKPQLEIFADDVKCTHGATVGQLDENAEFYLRSRGIPKDHARKILIHAFASDITQRIPNKTIRSHIESLLNEVLEQNLKDQTARGKTSC